MKIELTETEIIHIMDSLRLRVQDLRDCDDAESADLANELEELEHDLFEASARRDDWTEDLEPTDLEGRTFTVAESDFIDHGIRAREMAKTQKATSMAADRRTMRFGEFSVDKPRERERSEQQGVDVWDANDPRNW